jgi:hypothetical protein
VRRVTLIIATALAAVAGSLAGGGSAAVTPPQQFVTGIFDPLVFGTAERDVGMDETKAAGATILRLTVDWRKVAPVTPPEGFNARDHTSPAYNWSEPDGQLLRAAKRGLSAIIDIINPPNWASEGRSTKPGYDGPINPNPQALADFAFAAATRYIGTFHRPNDADALPRVKLWQAWNEPNLGGYLMPQVEGDNAVSPELYRNLVNAFSASVKSVAADNVVIAGGLSPFLADPGFSVAPLKFMRELLCVSPSGGSSCNASVSFDVWSNHPYTSGGPNHHAHAADDVSLGDLPDVRKVLDAAVRLGHVKSSGRVQFWITEFSWDSKPPDPEGVPAATQARWISEAFFRMWQNGVGMVIWYKIHDEPFPASFYQSGLFTDTGSRKPAFQAFRFPFVALKAGTKVQIWGRTPTSATGNVAIEQRFGSRWRRVLVLKANANGVFYSTPKLKTTIHTVMRARFGTDLSLPFALGPTKDVPVKPFGVF